MSSAPIVTLTAYELVMAGTVGVKRYATVIARKIKDPHGQEWNPGSWDRHIEGACGELACAKYLGRFWSGSVDTFHAGADIGNDIQVRTSGKDDYCLIVYDSDPDAHAYFLLVGALGSYRIAGWLYGHEAKRAEWKTVKQAGRPPAYFIRQEFLHAPESFGAETLCDPDTIY